MICITILCSMSEVGKDWKMPLTIGGLSKRTGVHIETIRYYEKISLLPAPERSPGGHRHYDDAGVRRLHFIHRGRELGFSLEEIRTFLDLVDHGKYTCAEVHELTSRHLSSIRQKIIDLHKLETVLSDMAGSCSRGDIPQCPVIDALFETKSGGDKP